MDRIWRRGIVAIMLGIAAVPNVRAESIEPVRWGYKAVDANGELLAQLTGLTEENWSDFFMPDPRTKGELVPDSNPYSPLKTERWVSEARVTITDELSGEHGDVDIFRDWIRQVEEKWDGSIEPIYEGEGGGPWPEYSELQLGNLLFQVRAPGGELSIAVNQRVPDLDPPIDSPEPSTLALVTLGAAVIAIQRRRRAAPRETAVT
jgi:PEP-CTERM motif